MLTLSRYLVFPLLFSNKDRASARGYMACETRADWLQKQA